MSDLTLSLKTAAVFEPLLAPAPYKGADGGRGSGKSHFFAEALIEDCLAEPGNSGEGMRAVCIREVQKDLAQSSKLLIETKLNQYRLGENDGFKVFKDVIKTPGDGLMIFKGMNDYTADSIKSLEGFKRGWWEEAQTATMHSLNLYRPTLRANGAERWFSWNARRKGDPIEWLFGAGMPTGAIKVRANWRDNPFFNDELERERQDCLRTQPEMYDHIWEGGYVQIISGAYYAQALNQARLDGRIGRVPADPLLSHHLFFDIGGTGAKADAVTIWDFQFIGKETRALDYYEASSQPLATHVEWMRSRNLTPKRAKIWLPHDGDTHDKVFDTSYESYLKGIGYDVTVVPNQGKGAAKARIEAGRKEFSSIWFNKPENPPEDSPTTAGGLDALGWYHEKRDDERGIGLGPEHDWASHGADSFGLACICAKRIRESMGKDRKKPLQVDSRGIV